MGCASSKECGDTMMKRVTTKGGCRDSSRPASTTEGAHSADNVRRGSGVGASGRR